MQNTSNEIKKENTLSDPMNKNYTFAENNENKLETCRQFCSAQKATIQCEIKAKRNDYSSLSFKMQMVKTPTVLC